MDIDIDLSPSKRKLILNRIRQERGELNVLQVATFGSEGTRSAIQTACRGYRSPEYPKGIDVDIAQYLSTLIPQERGFLWSLKDVVYGNEEKNRKPIKTFIEEVNKYPGLLDIMMSIEGLINKRGQHASGIMLYNDNPFETNAIMKSPNGDLITQFELHDSELLGDVKYDFLLTEICDKITNCLNLLQKDNIIDKNLTLKQAYNKYLHPEAMNLDDPLIWNALSTGSVLDVFQFNSDVGLQAAKMIKPKNPTEMMMANALMRLMAEKGKERPLERYTRLKADMNQWYQEVKAAGLSEEEIKVLEPYYLPRCGTPTMQEDLMLVTMDKNISAFSLKEANAARKVVAKKQMDKIPELKQKFLSQCKSQKLANYVWTTTMEPQMGYAFSTLHSLAYSFVGIQTLILATQFPSIYWNCACLITNSGGNEDAEDETEEIVSIYEIEDDPDADYEDLPDRSGKKKKTRNTNYGKISTAIGQMRNRGISIAPPDINKSSFTFVPDAENNTIIYGIKGITRIGSEIIEQIMENRPFVSIEDFLSKVKVNKPQMVNLIKSGAFDCFGDRIDIMHEYIDSISDKKKRLTLQNMQMLINFNLLPEEFNFEIALYNFNKYLKKNKREDNDSYILDDIANKFFIEHYSDDYCFYEENNGEIKKYIPQKIWDNIYKTGMNPVREYLKRNKEEKLEELNSILFQETYKKYCTGNISKWEMDSIGFYYHSHELQNVEFDGYEIEDFNSLNTEPEIEREVFINGKTVPIYKIHRLAGTVIDKNKNKNSISLLTTYGVVNVKIYQAQYAKYDKRISEVDINGTKKVKENSWFTRGNKILVTGIRRDDTFQLKKYKNTKGEVIQLVKGITADNKAILQTKRYGEE